VSSPLLLVSPHFDDAVLSAAALLEAGAEVLTVFGGAPEPAISTDWDRRSGFADSNEAMRRRIEEDAAALAHYDCTQRMLDLWETQYRVDHDPSDAYPGLLAAAIDAWLDDTPGGLVALPVCAGGQITLAHRLRFKLPYGRLRLPGGGPPHVDHRWVTATLLGHLLPRGADVLLYEDMPYAWVRRGDEQAQRWAGEYGVTLRTQSRPVDVTRKAAAVDEYRSQRAGLFAPWVADTASVLPAVERSWLLTPAADDA
jgi:hypothetical protein